MDLIHSDVNSDFRQQSPKYKKLYKKIANRIKKEESISVLNNDTRFTPEEKNQLKNLLQPTSRKLSSEEELNKQKYEKLQQEHLQDYVKKSKKKKKKKKIKKKKLKKYLKN